MDAGDTPPCHCEECVSTTSQSYDLVNPRQSQTRIKTCHSETPKAGSESVRKFAFTLAEVLITLGIIGVVAALAIPTLISNNNKRIVETRLAKFYSNMNQAVELSEVENGSKEKWE
ncbi:type II secretion system protein, partial [bacterium]|nr:type II secretion system protein [bacterium]